MSERTGVSSSYLSNLERGVVEQPSPAVIVKIADGYRLPTVELMQLAGWPVFGPNEVHAERIPLFNGEELTAEEAAELQRYLGILRGRRPR